MDIVFNKCIYKDTSMSKHQCIFCDYPSIPKRYYKIEGYIITKKSRKDIKWYLCSECFNDHFSENDFEIFL